MDGADPFFVDTNLLLYAIDPASPAKRSAARSWLDALWLTQRGRISWQVLHEFSVNACRKMKTPVAAVRAAVEIYAVWRPLDTNLGLVRRAWFWQEAAGLSYWDCLILAAAEQSACRVLLSEDFQDGRRFESLTVVNPFRTAPADFDAHFPTT